MPTQSQVQQFVQRFLPIAQAMQQKYGMPAYALLSQVAHETNYGTSNFMNDRNNTGGIGANDSNPNGAFTFNSPEEAMDYQARLQMNKVLRPENKKLAEAKYGASSQILADPNHSPEQVFAAMQDSGWASDPNYGQSLMTRYKQMVPFIKNLGAQPVQAAEQTPAPNPITPPSTPNNGMISRGPSTEPVQNPAPAPYQDNRPGWQKFIQPYVPPVKPTPSPAAQGMKFTSPTGETSRINTQGQTFASPAPESHNAPVLDWVYNSLGKLFGGK